MEVVVTTRAHCCWDPVVPCCLALIADDAEPDLETIPHGNNYIVKEKIAYDKI